MGKIADCPRLKQGHFSPAGKLTVSRITLPEEKDLPKTLNNLFIPLDTHASTGGSY